MAKLQKIETTHYIYEYELSEKENKLYLESPDEFWDNFEEEWSDPHWDVDSTPTELNYIED